MNATNVIPLQRVALSQDAEARINAKLGDIAKLPEFNDALAELVEQIKRESPQDVQVALPSLSMDDDSFVMYGGTSYKYTRHALNQMVARIKPQGVIGMGGYLAACPPELRSLNFNYWHEAKFAGADVNDRQNKAVMRIREDDDNSPMIRGVVSTTYVPVDDLPIMNRIASLVPGGSRMRVARGDLKSRYTIVWPNANGKIDASDPVNVAVHLVNSETGVSSIRMEPLVHMAEGYSMIVPVNDTEVMIRHVGEASTRLSNALLRTAEETAPFIEKLNDAKNDPTPSTEDEFNELMKRISSAFDLSDARMGDIRKTFEAMGQPNRAGLAAAISTVANDLDIETGETLQRAAGVIIKNGWRLLRG